MILFDDTIRQSTRDGAPFPEVMRKAGIIPGIKVDQGAKDMAGHPGEKITEGVDGPRGRLAEYKKIRARFAQWGGVITNCEGGTSPSCTATTTHAPPRC